MFAGRTERRDVPHEAGAWIEFRTLSGAQLDEAERDETRESLKLFTGGMDEGVISAMQKAAETGSAQGSKGAERPAATSYARSTLIRYGIAAWSAEEPCDDEHKQLLDSATRDWAVSVILEMNVRPEGEGIGSEQP